MLALYDTFRHTQYVYDWDVLLGLIVGIYLLISWSKPNLRLDRANNSWWIIYLRNVAIFSSFVISVSRLQGRFGGSGWFGLFFFFFLLYNFITDIQNLHCTYQLPLAGEVMNCFTRVKAVKFWVITLASTQQSIYLQRWLISLRVGEWPLRIGAKAPYLQAHVCSCGAQECPTSPSRKGTNSF